MAMSRSLGAMPLTTWPSMEIVPWVISSNPAIRRRVVDLPQPEGPTNTRNSPSSTTRLALLTARMLSRFGPVKILVRFSMTTRAILTFFKVRRRMSSAELGAHNRVDDAGGLFPLWGPWATRLQPTLTRGTPEHFRQSYNHESGFALFGTHAGNQNQD